jgi:hypothetical protein
MIHIFLWFHFKSSKTIKNQKHFIDKRILSEGWKLKWENSIKNLINKKFSNHRNNFLINFLIFLLWKFSNDVSNWFFNEMKQS